MPKIGVELISTPTAMIANGLLLRQPTGESLAGLHRHSLGSP